MRLNKVNAVTRPILVFFIFYEVKKIAHIKCAIMVQKINTLFKTTRAFQPWVTQG